LANYGSDFSAIDDFDAHMTLLDADDPLVVAQSLARRLQTQRYALFYDPTLGTDLRSYIADIQEASIVAGAIGIECRKDERVSDAKATIATVGETWTIQIEATLQSGVTFTMTVSVDDLTVELLTVN